MLRVKALSYKIFHRLKGYRALLSPIEASAIKVYWKLLDMTADKSGKEVLESLSRDEITHVI
jgi:ferritin-like protein